MTSSSGSGPRSLRDLAAAVVDHATTTALDLPGGEPRSELGLCALLVVAARRATPIGDDALEHQVLGAECRLAMLGHRPPFSAVAGRMMLLVRYAELHGSIDGSEVLAAVSDYLEQKHGMADHAVRTARANVAGRVRQMWEEIEREQVRLRRDGDRRYRLLAPRLPDGAELPEHQREFLSLVEARGGRVALCDDQGLGKTVQVLCAMLQAGTGSCPALVLATTSMVGTWCREARHWLADMRPAVVTLGNDLRLAETPEERALRLDVQAMRRRLASSDLPSDEQVAAWAMSRGGMHPEVPWKKVSWDPQSRKIIVSTDRDRRDVRSGADRLLDVPRLRMESSARALQAWMRETDRTPDQVRRAASRLRESDPTGMFDLHVDLPSRSVSVRVDAGRAAVWRQRPLVVVASWAELLLYERQIGSVKWATVVGDETHRCLRALGSKTTQVTQTTVRGARRVMMLTGTLTPNGRPIQAYPVLRMVRPDLVPPWKVYGEKFCGARSQFVSGRKRPVRVYDGRSCEPEFAQLLAQIQIRRVKAQLAPGSLPEKRRYAVHVDLHDADRLEIEAVKDAVRADLEARAEALRLDLEAKNVPPDRVTARVRGVLQAAAAVSLGRARIVTGLIKVRRCRALLAELLDDDRVVLFAEHHAVHAALVGAAGDLVGPDQVLTGTGQMGNAQDRTDLCARWQRGEGRALVLTRAFSEGVTLTSARLLVMMERFWEPGAEDQAEDRLHRYTQDRDVGIYYPHATGSTDDVVGELVTWKARGAAHLQGSMAERALQWLEVGT